MAHYKIRYRLRNIDELRSFIVNPPKRLLKRDLTDAIQGVPTSARLLSNDIWGWIKSHCSDRLVDASSISVDVYTDDGEHLSLPLNVINASFNEL